MPRMNPEQVVMARISGLTYEEAGLAARRFVGAHVDALYGDPFTIVALGYSARRDFEGLSDLFRGARLSFAVLPLGQTDDDARRVYPIGKDVTGLEKVPVVGRDDSANDFGDHLVVFDSSARTGTSFVSAFRYVLDGIDAGILSPADLYLAAIVDDLGVAHFSMCRRGGKSDLGRYLRDAGVDIATGSERKPTIAPLPDNRGTSISFVDDAPVFSHKAYVPQGAVSAIAREALAMLYSGGERWPVR